MQGLAGDFGTMSFPDLIQYLGSRNLTGTVVCELSGQKKSLSIRDGEVFNAASNDPREYLGQFLINFGHVSEDQLNKAFQTQSETKILLGKILVMIGLVTESVLADVLKIKLRETALALCRWKEGTFRFARGVLPPEADGVNVSVPLLDIHREAEFRETVWEAMLQAFPSPQISFKVDEAKAPKGLAAGSMDAQLFDLMRDGQTMEEISLRLHANDFHLYQRLYALYRQQVIAPIEPLHEIELGDDTAEAPIQEEKVGEEVGAQAVLNAAREFVRQQQWADAEALARRAVELDPRPESQALLKEIEAGMLAQLRREMIATPRAPALTRPITALKDLGLSPQEKYLLSRVDGKRDLAAIVKVSPMRELDALRAFQRFIEMGLIALHAA